MGGRLRVLVVDDEEGIRLGVARVLEKFVASFPDIAAEISYDIESAASGEDAVERLRDSPPDILLLDLKLPGIGGLDVLREARNLDPPVLTIMITAYASVTTAVEATRGGTFDFLPKPFTPNEIKACVRRATRDLVLSRQAKKLAAEQRRTRFELIRVLVHELKAPLSAVEGYLASILDGVVNDEETRRHVVTRSIARIQGMRQLILDLLDVTRLEAGVKARVFSTVQLTDLARECMEALRSQAEAKHLTVEIGGTPNLELVAVRAEIEIVLNNLLTNAIKYNRDGGSVRVSLGRRDDVFEIAVQDTGFGLSRDDAAKLFNDFVRIKNAKTRGIEGSGLGLATVKRIAALYDGDATVNSELDTGSTFTVTLKADLPEKAALPEKQAQP
jgi:two-component system, sensor histidine kinase and response regulator